MAAQFFPGIDPVAWEHPADAAAMAALRRLPGFEQVVRRTVGRLNEWSMAKRLLEGATSVSPELQPRLYAAYDDVLMVLDAPRVPLWTKEMAVLNAGAAGMDQPFIVISASAEHELDDESLRVVLGHEVAHLLSGHVVYKSMLRAMLCFGWAALAPVSTPIVLVVAAALLEWDRKSELSADRAAALVVGGPGPVVRTLQHVHSDHQSVLSAGMGADDDARRRFQRLVESAYQIVSPHPPLDKRIGELRAWTDSPQWLALCAGDYPRRVDRPEPLLSSLDRSLAALGRGLRAFVAP